MLGGSSCLSWFLQYCVEFVLGVWSCVVYLTLASPDNERTFALSLGWCDPEPQASNGRLRFALLFHVGVSPSLRLKDGEMITRSLASGIRRGPHGRQVNAVFLPSAAKTPSIHTASHREMVMTYHGQRVAFRCVSPSWEEFGRLSHSFLRFGLALVPSWHDA